MKIKNYLLASSLVFLAVCSSAFIVPVTKSSEGGIQQDLELIQKIEKPDFVKFLSHFEKTATPFGAGLDQLKQYEAAINTEEEQRGKRQSRDRYESFRNYIPEWHFGMYSRMGPPSVEPLARFYPSEDLVAVTYLTFRPFEFTQNLQVNLAIYDLQGNCIVTTTEESPKIVEYTSFPLGGTYTDITQTFTINEEGYIWKNSYKNIWKEDLADQGVLDNKIIDYELTSTEVFQFAPDGKISLVKEYPIASRASLGQ